MPMNEVRKRRKRKRNMTELMPPALDSPGLHSPQLHSNMTNASNVGMGKQSSQSGWVLSKGNNSNNLGSFIGKAM